MHRERITNSLICSSCIRPLLWNSEQLCFLAFLRFRVEWNRTGLHAFARIATPRWKAATRPKFNAASLAWLCLPASWNCNCLCGVLSFLFQGINRHTYHVRSLDTFVSPSLSVCLSVCLSLWYNRTSWLGVKHKLLTYFLSLCVSLCLCLSVCFSLSLSVSLSVCLSVSLSLSARFYLFRYALARSKLWFPFSRLMTLIHYTPCKISQTRKNTPTTHSSDQIACKFMLSKGEMTLWFTGRLTGVQGLLAWRAGRYPAARVQTSVKAK